MKVVILCGGKGIRYTNQYNELPKALATIGNVPILGIYLNISLWIQ
ncbi:MAG: hypothetical protein R2753_13100 [Chitinophagales bacterium]